MTRENPRVSVNKLGEYMVAKPGRRLSIIRNQKRPADFIVAYYSQAEDAIAESIVQDHPDGFLETKIQELEKKTVSSDWDATRKSICIEALDYFTSFAKDAKFSTYRCSRGAVDQPKTIIGGLTVSVRPEILLLDKERQIVGAVKLIFSKGRSAEAEEVEYIGAVLNHYMKEQHDPDCSHKDCYVIDVFAGTVTKAPKAFRKRMKDVEASCLEILDTWRRA